MTKDEIFEMARQAGFEGCAELTWENVICTEELEAFAKLVAKHTLLNIDPSSFMSFQEGFEVGRLAEREACAKLCDLAMFQNQEAINELEEDEHIAQCFIQGAMTQLVKTSNAIRARGEQE